MLENQKVPIPVTKTLLLTKQDDILYLIDINTRADGSMKNLFLKLKPRQKNKYLDI